MESIIQNYILYFLAIKYNISCYFALSGLSAELSVMSLSRKVGNKKPLGSIAGEAALQEGAVLRVIVIESLYLANNPAVHRSSV
jgi:hypothetical protein